LFVLADHSTYIMERYQQSVDIRWSDLDPNFHLRHSVYYDWGAMVRIKFLAENGLTPQVMQQNNIGPILFREECVFKREIHLSDKVTVDLQLAKVTADGSRWTMVHNIYKNGDTLSAIITIDGAWINTQLRKLAVPPPPFAASFDKLPKTSDFILIPNKPA